ncbi:MAG TPA: hypothetical protein VMM12_07285 [Longimicrobiales bacterium]|nr:hypothetical protein [Longimicrobiales bacterium]
MTETSGKRRTSAVARLAAPLILIAVAGCDNVEWGGVQFAVVPPPERVEVTASELEAADRLPDGPVLYYVRRDSVRAEVTPVGAITDEGMEPLEPGADPEGFGNRFIAAYLREGAELTLFTRGRRAGTLIVDSARVPTADACKRVPRATGLLELSGGAGEATEFLAMARTQAPDGRAMPGDPQIERRMQILGPILAERTLRARGAQLPNWATAGRQIFPFPSAEARDLAFTATFLVDDELQVGNDDQGYSLFVVYTPQAQAGYDTAYVSYRSYPQGGKAAPRVIDFLDWDRDGTPELLLEVYGTRNSWFEAIGATDGGWTRILQDRCDPAPPAMAADSAAADTAAGRVAPTTPQRQAPAVQPPPRPTPRPDTARTTRSTIPVPDIEPALRLAVPRPPPDSSGGA